MPKKTRRRWSPEEKAEITERFHASGLSREAFARQEDIAASVLSNWIRKSRGALLEPQPGLVAVQVKREKHVDDGLIEIIVRDFRIRVRRGFDAELLGQVIAALEC